VQLPPLLSSRPVGVQVVLAGVVPAVYGAVCGLLLGASEALYLIAVVLAILGGYAAGLDHESPGSGALRGVLGGFLFGSFILLAHEVTGAEAKADLPDPAIVLLVVTVVPGALLGALGAWTRARREPPRPA
jgi:hypothetical protein